MTTKADIIARYARPGMTVLDIGFAGQAVAADNPNSPHSLLKQTGATVYGLDLTLPDGYDRERYREGSADNFDFGRAFDAIFAFDLIEHLSNPGLFLACCRKHLAPGGALILTTPNAHGFYPMLLKLFHGVAPCNPDHVAWYDAPTVLKLLNKNGWHGEVFYMPGKSVSSKLPRTIRKVAGWAYRTLPCAYWTHMAITAV